MVLIREVMMNEMMNEMIMNEMMVSEMVVSERQFVCERQRFDPPMIRNIWSNSEVFFSSKLEFCLDHPESICCFQVL